jgi:hypothetical protein
VRVVVATLVFGFSFGVASVPVTCDPAVYLRSEFCARRRVGQNRARAPTLLSPKLTAPSLILYLVIRSVGAVNSVGPLLDADAHSFG